MRTAIERFYTLAMNFGSWYRYDVRVMSPPMSLRTYFVEDLIREREHSGRKPNQLFRALMSAAPPNAILTSALPAISACNGTLLKQAVSQCIREALNI